MYFFSVCSGDVDVAQLRALFGDASHEEMKARQLILKTENEKHNALAMGYYGAGKMLMAKFHINPITKWSSFNRGRDALETAIQSDCANPELRYLRLAIQQNAPHFLGYHQNIKEDQNFLTQCLPLLKDVELKELITDYLNQN